MKKVLLLLVVLGAAAFNSFGQTSSKNDGGKFGIGLEAGLPVGDASNGYNLFIGGSLKYEAPLSEGLAVTGTAGYTALMTKSSLKAFGAKSSYGYVPVKAGLKYYFSEDFYGEAQLGVTFSTQSGGGSAFAYSPGIGYNFGGGVDLGIRYETWSKNGSVSQVAGRLGFNF